MKPFLAVLSVACFAILQPQLLKGQGATQFQHDCATCHALPGSSTGPVLSSTFILFLVTVISVSILQMKKSTLVITPLIVVTILGIVVQVARAYHYRAISFGSTVVIVALAWALQRIFCAASFLKYGS